MNKFLFKHPVVGAFLLVGGIFAAVVLGGMAYDLAPKLALGVCVAVLVMMALAGNRHFS